MVFLKLAVLNRFYFTYHPVCCHLLTLCILVDFPIYIDTISLGLPVSYFVGSQVEVSNYDAFLSLKVV